MLKFMRGILSVLNEAETSVYRVLGNGGRQSELHIIAEYVISVVICLNVTMIVLESMSFSGRFGTMLAAARHGFFVFFLIEYILRVWIADMVMDDKRHPVLSRIRYIFTPTAIIDLLALLPVLIAYLPAMRGVSVIDFRIFRILRLIRIIQLKSVRRYTDMLSRVFKLKGAQLVASLFIAFVFMLASAIIIYDFENKAQPYVFDNILSCLWWSISAVTTVGYGDIYPITPMGKFFGSAISICGIFLMAVPVAILTAGFFEIASQDEAKEKERAAEREAARAREEQESGASGGLRPPDVPLGL